MGFNMPAWAMIAGAPYAADKLVVDPIKNILDLAKNINEMRYDANTSEDLRRLQEMGRSADVQKFIPQPNSAGNMAALGKYRSEKLKELYQQEAMPVVSEAAKYLADPEFRSNPEALQEFQSRPAYWLDASTTINNPSVIDALKQFSSTAKTQETQGALGDAIKKNQANPFAVMDPYYLGQAAVSKDAVDNIDKIAQLGGKERSALASVDFFKGIANAANQTDGTAAYNIFANTVANVPNVSKENMETGLNLLKQKFPEMKFEKIFTGKGEEQQVAGINPLTGEYLTVGNAGLPSAPKITNVLPQQESAYSKKKGEYLAEREAGIIKAGDDAENLLTSIDSLDAALKRAPAGPYSGALLGTGKWTGSLLGAKPEQVAAATEAEVIAKQLVAQDIRKFGPGITNEERKFLVEMQAQTSMTREQQAKVLDIARRNAGNAISKKNDVLGATFGEGGRSEKGVKPGNAGLSPAGAAYRKKMLGGK